jgi:hypothetical protein
MRPNDFSPSLSPEQRRRDVASILAGGLLRLDPPADATPAASSTSLQNPCESQRDCLEVRADLRLSVPSGLRPNLTPRS